MLKSQISIETLNVTQNSQKIPPSFMFQGLYVIFIFKHGDGYNIKIKIYLTCPVVELLLIMNCQNYIDILNNLNRKLGYSRPYYKTVGSLVMKDYMQVSK